MFREMQKITEDKTDKEQIAKKEEKGLEKREKRQKEIKINKWKKKIEIVRVVGKKENNLLEIRMVEKMISKRFHEYFKMFEKKVSERISMRKLWNHAIDLRKEFVLMKGKSISYRDKGSTRVFKEPVEKEIYNCQSCYRHHQYYLFQKEIERRGWYRLSIFEQLDYQEQLSIAIDFRFDK